MWQLILASALMCQPNDNSFCLIKPISVYDGDTVTVELPDVHPLIGRHMSIRLAGVDTPERTSSVPCEKVLAEKARTYIAKRVFEATRIDLLRCKPDKYFRLVCDLYADGSSLSEELLKKKMAVVYNGGTKVKFKCAQ